MTKVTLNTKYETDRKSGKGGTTLSLNTALGDALLEASVTDSLALDAAQYLQPSFAFSLKKPNSFAVDYAPPNKGSSDPAKNKLPNVKFKFMNSLKLMGKEVHLTYDHALAEQKTAVDGDVKFNAGNRMAVKHVVGTSDCTLKYTYEHGQRRRIVVEPTYYVADRYWALAVQRKFEGGDALKASYQEKKTKTMELEWSRESKERGNFKVSASLEMKDRELKPKLMAASTWSYDL